jgi:hypothetical protein
MGIALTKSAAAAAATQVFEAAALAQWFSLLFARG